MNTVMSNRRDIAVCVANSTGCHQNNFQFYIFLSTYGSGSLELWSGLLWGGLLWGGLLWSGLRWSSLLWGGLLDIEAKLLGRSLLGRSFLGRSFLGRRLLSDSLGGWCLSNSSCGELRWVECRGRHQKQSKNCSNLHC